MTTFKQFLTEKAVGVEPQYQPIDLAQAVKILKTECRASLWMLEENKPFYRGMKTPGIDHDGILTVDTSATERQSQNTTNYYTVIFDNSPYYQDFPKRSRSFIASTSLVRASEFVKDAMVMIPTDDAKIGVIGKDDMWYTVIKFNGQWLDVEDMNRELESLEFPATLRGFEEFAAKVKDPDSPEYKRLRHWVSSKALRKRLQADFMGELYKMYAPTKTKHKAFTAATLPHNLSRNTEVWVGGKVVLITLRMWKKLLERGVR